MKKLKLLVIIATLICAFTALCVCTNAATYSGTCGANGDNLTWTLDTSTGVLEIDGTGKMKNWTYSFYAPWYSYHSSIKTVTLGSGVTSIGDYAFGDCYSLESVEMPSVTSIGEGAFFYCTSLASVEIPASVTSIGTWAFAYCDSLASITVDEANTNYSSDEYGVLFNKDKITLIQYPIANSRTEYTVPDSVTSIGYEAFRNCASLASVEMPSVTSIGAYAFYNCYSLASVSMPSVTSIGGCAFRGCNSLASVEIPASVTSISNWAFEDCSNLKKATIYSKTATFDSDVFYNTHTDFEIHGYTGSTAETYANKNGHIFVPLDAREITAQGYCGGEGDGTNLSWILYADGELVISGTGEMKNWSSYLSVPWYSYRSSIKTVTLGESVISIGDYAFEYCESIASVSMPSVTSIGDYAFFYCTSLASVEIPASVTSIGTSTFRYCYSLESITVDEANTKYSSDEYGVLFNKDKITLIQYPIANSRTEYTVPDSVTSIGYEAFRNCDSLASVSMPNVTIIGDLAFIDCDSLESVEMPASVTSIGEWAFSYCSNFKKAVIYSTTATFGSNVFKDTHADFEIHGYVGSTAQTYANANNHTFVPLDDEYLPGDPDGNGTVNIRDAAVVLQYIAGWEVSITEAAADVDCNGTINIRDAALILQYIAGWEVTLG